MKERSLMERIVAILGVLLGTIAWVLRLLSSLVAGVLKGKTTQDEETQKASASTQARRGEQLVQEAREKGQHLVVEVREKGETLLGDARERGGALIDDIRHHDEAAKEEGDREAHFTAEGTTSDTAGITSTQHEDLGGVSQTGNVASVGASSMDAGHDEGAASSMNDKDTAVEFGTDTGRDADTLDEDGSESGAVFDEEETEYAGQAVSESDIGIDRGDSVSELADSEEIRGWISDEIDVVDENGEGPYAETGEDEGNGETWVEIEEPNPDHATGEAGYDATWVSDEVDDENEDEIPAASRGWEEREDDVLKDDPLSGDFGSSGTGGEVDLRNDELDEEDSASMHVVDSPDEPFIEDEEASESLGFVDTGREPAFDTGIDEETDVDEIGDSREFLSEDSLAADALGHPAGHDAASGDLGPDESPDDATWDPGASRPDYDVLGAYDGSGVDDFASDALAEDMLADVTGDKESGETSREGESGGEASSSDTGSVAWATTAGVIEPDLVKPMSVDEPQGQGGTQGAESLDNVGEPGITEADAGWRDAASEAADDLGDETAGREMSTGTTMSGAGQSAGAMTADDAANDERGDNEMTTDEGAPESGGLPASGTEGPGDVESGDERRQAMGVGQGDSFNDVLPDSEYAESVGYDMLEVDETGGSTEFPGDDRFATVSTSSTGPSGVTPVGGKDATSGRSRKPAPAGAVRGDGSRECPADFPIKGNANSHIYHRPTDASYESTIPEFCFATEADAKAAGFRPRKG